MKKLLIALCCLPTFSFADQTGESCSNIEDSTKRLECYDSLFMKKEDVKADDSQAVKSEW